VKFLPNLVKLDNNPISSEDKISAGNVVYYLKAEE